MKNKSDKMKSMKSSDSKENTITFNVMETHNYDKSVWWFLLAFLAFAFIIVSTIELHQIFLGVIVVLGMVVFYQLALVESKPTKFILTESGLTFRDKFYAWDIFHSFSVFGSDKHMSVHLETLSQFSSQIVIPLPHKMGYLSEDEDIDDRDLALNVLRRFVPEKLKASHNLNDWLSHVFKF